jgi:hypothetical protein
VGTDQQFDNLVEDANNFGILKWDFNKPTTTVNFLDLSITVKEDKITTRTHQKKGNPYLYITPHSAHPPGMIKGVIFGLVRCYYEQNSDKKDFIDFTKMLLKRLVARGWDPTYIKPIFDKAIQKTQSETKTQDQLNLQNSSPQKRNQLFLHFNYHPSDIPRYTIRKLHEEELKDTLIQELPPDTTITICYKHQKNIQDIVAKATLFKEIGKEVSKCFMGDVDMSCTPPFYPLPSGVSG